MSKYLKSTKDGTIYGFSEQLAKRADMVPYDGKLPAPGKHFHPTEEVAEEVEAGEKTVLVIANIGDITLGEEKLLNKHFTLVEYQPTIEDLDNPMDLDNSPENKVDEDGEEETSTDGTDDKTDNLEGETAGSSNPTGELSLEVAKQVAVVEAMNFDELKVMAQQMEVRIAHNISEENLRAKMMEAVRNAG